MGSTYVVCSVEKRDRLEIPVWGWTDYYIRPDIADLVGEPPKLTSIKYSVKHIRSLLLRSDSSSDGNIDGNSDGSSNGASRASTSEIIGSDSIRHDRMIRVDSVPNTQTIDKRIFLSTVYTKTIKRKFHRTIRYTETQLIPTAIPVTEPLEESLDRIRYTNDAYIMVGRGRFPRIDGIPWIVVNSLFGSYGSGELHAGNQYVTSDAIYKFVIDDAVPCFIRNIKMMTLESYDKCISTMRCNFCYNCNKKIKNGRLLECRHMVTCNKCYAKTKVCAKCRY